MSQGREAVLREAQRFPRFVVTPLDNKLGPSRHWFTYCTGRGVPSVTSRKHHTQIRPQPEIFLKAWPEAENRPVFLTYRASEKKNSHRSY